MGTSPLKLVASFPFAWRVLRHEKPQVLVSTGSEIAIPFFLLARLLHIRTVFVEGLFRVRTSSSHRPPALPAVRHFSRAVAATGAGLRA